MIVRLYVQNFRCLESLTLEFANNTSTLIIGRNGTGKSTVLAQVELAHGAVRRLWTSAPSDLVSVERMILH